jgi:hypothetical protein
VGVRVIDENVGQYKSLVALTPRFDMRPEMELRLFGHPRRLRERCDQFVGAWNELDGVANAAPAVVTVPSWRHTAPSYNIGSHDVRRQLTGFDIKTGIQRLLAPALLGAARAARGGAGRWRRIGPCSPRLTASTSRS